MQTHEKAVPVIVLINVGDEIVDGLCENEHLRRLGDLLARNGLFLKKNIVVRDDDGELAGEFCRSWQSSDVVILTGGLGTRFDDHTREIVARCFAKHSAENGITGGRFPEKAELLPNPNGNAPGILYVEGKQILVMLPGNPIEAEEIFLKHVLPVLRPRVKKTDGIVSEVRVTAYGLSLTETQDKILPIINRAGIKIVTADHAGLIDMRLMPGASGVSADGLLEIVREIRDALGEDFVCSGNRTLAELVAELLLSAKKTLGVAESCTGGLLAGMLTEIPGISKVFVAGAVTYSSEMKEILGVPAEILSQHGEVSAESALALAAAAAEKFGTDYGISITGVAGPSGGTDTAPVGTVYIGYSSPRGDWAQHCRFEGDRRAVRAQAVNAALDLLRRKLIKYRVEDLVADVL